MGGGGVWGGGGGWWGGKGGAGGIRSVAPIIILLLVLSGPLLGPVTLISEREKKEKPLTFATATRKPFNAPREPINGDADKRSPAPSR